MPVETQEVEISISEVAEARRQRDEAVRELHEMRKLALRLAALSYNEGVEPQLRWTIAEVTDAAQASMPWPEPHDGAERIVAAAIHHDGITHFVKPPARHDSVCHLVFAQGLPPAACRHQGFLTSYGRFVDRIEGARLAIGANQLIRKTHPKDMLFSEDGW